jgi:hypothetical protein
MQFMIKRFALACLAELFRQRLIRIKHFSTKEKVFKRILSMDFIEEIV